MKKKIKQTFGKADLQEAKIRIIQKEDLIESLGIIVEE